MLVEKFQLILNLTDMASELQYEDLSFFSGIDLIDTELENLKSLLKPLISMLEK
ncbi:MAG: hypothetical protein KGD65_05655 [Candidatus Lokiarchaeota archaeon]|nr:hypothetical protein [Candidatus Lokiarchaeota archaeon]